MLARCVVIRNVAGVGVGVVTGAGSGDAVVVAGVREGRMDVDVGMCENVRGIVLPEPDELVLGTGTGRGRGGCAITCDEVDRTDIAVAVMRTVSLARTTSSGAVSFIVAGRSGSPQEHNNAHNEMVEITMVIVFMLLPPSPLLAVASSYASRPAWT